MWAGVDAGKSHQHCVVLDEGGKRLLSRRVRNDENDLLELLADVVELSEGEHVRWATDLNHGGAALMISLLADHGQELVYVPGRTIHHASRTYRGNGKTDAKDAGIIADQARMRRDLQPLRSKDQLSVDLRLLTARRADLVADRTRCFNRMRAMLLEYFPALEASFDYANTKAALVLLTKCQTPDRLRRLGRTRLAAWLTRAGCRNATTSADEAVSAAERQQTTVPSQHVGADLVAKLAAEILALHNAMSDLDTRIEEHFRRHAHADILLSLPGFGPKFAAEFLAATGGDTATFNGADRLAGVAGLASAPKDSGRISGNHHRPHRYDRRLLRVCYLSAQIAARYCPASRAYYQRKRAEGKSPKQAVLALARRRINVVWAMLRDHQPYRPAPAPASKA